jgi:hypothetical protein
MEQRGNELMSPACRGVKAPKISVNPVATSFGFSDEISAAVVVTPGLVTCPVEPLDE